MSIDIRRLDLTKVNLLGIDLSQFSLDGVNLCGTYIDPKHLLSLGSLQKRFYDLRRTKDKKRKKMEEALLEEKEEALRLFAKQQKIDKVPENIFPKRPDKKQIVPDGYILWPQGKEEIVQTGIQEETLVETPNEPKTIISNQSVEQQLPEESIKKISSKQRELQKTNTKIKG